MFVVLVCGCCLVAYCIGVDSGGLLFQCWICFGFALVVFLWFWVMLAELFSTGCLGFVIVVLVAGWLSS